MTLLMAGAAVVPATVLGVPLALVQSSAARSRASALQVYLFLVRGIPLLVLLTFVYYLLPLTGIDLPPFWGVVVVMSLLLRRLHERSVPRRHRYRCRRRNGTRRTAWA